MNYILCIYVEHNGRYIQDAVEIRKTLRVNHTPSLLHHSIEK